MAGLVANCQASAPGDSHPFSTLRTAGAQPLPSGREAYALGQKGSRSGLARHLLSLGPSWWERALGGLGRSSVPGRKSENANQPGCPHVATALKTRSRCGPQTGDAEQGLSLHTTSSSRAVGERRGLRWSTGLRPTATTGQLPAGLAPGILPQRCSHNGSGGKLD